MTVGLLIASIVRWVGLAALATLVGALTLELLVFQRERPELGFARDRLRRLGLACLAVLAVSTVGELLTRAQTMAGGDLGFAIHAVPAVLARTHFGAIWIARLVVLALALVIGWSASRGARTAALLLALGITVTTALTGHAADWGDLTLSTAVDWLHVVAMSAWTGGVMSLALAVLGRADMWPPALLGAVMQRFSRLAGICLAVVVVTGIRNAWVQLPGPAALWSTFYGRVLAVKLLFALALIWWGAVNRYAIVPRLAPRRRPGAGERAYRLVRWVLRGSSRPGRHVLSSRLRASVRGEALVVVFVLASTAVLVDSAPARHAEHAAHATVAEPGPFRATMEELHESGGVPKGWSFVPPAGDPARGRQVFVRLGCYACHQVRGEELPASSGIGPDLTGMGGHHPAGYILESILNPNAVIVEGPGYTGADGKSIMPEYRGQLSVNDLLDLVAYLKNV